MHELQDRADENLPCCSASTRQIGQCMGNIRNLQHGYLEAIEYHERTVTNMKFTLGETYYVTGDCLYRLGTDWERQGNNSKARSSPSFFNGGSAAAH